MNRTVLLERLAEAAHELWRDTMLGNGWRPADRYDEAEHLHDALVPFCELLPLDRREALLAARSLADQVVAEIAYQRGDDREFTVLDVVAGQPVTLSDGGRFEGEPRESLGEVISWEAEPESPFLSLIRVKWNSGDITEHAPSLRELRRVKPRPPR